ncbi:MAG: (deoxy)nucleoside triphosphate pyrophosphohydrolase [Myxococcota bacterium]
MSGLTALHVVGAAILEAGRCLVAQRGPSMSLAGLWEFPGGKVEARETPQQALVRELREELAIEVEVGPWLGRGESRTGARAVVLDVYAATRVAGEPVPREHAALCWIGPDEIDALAWPEADRPILSSLRRVLERGLEPDARMRPAPIVSVDWAGQPRGRAVYAALPRTEGGWRIARAAPPGKGWSFEAVLDFAEALAEPFGGAALVAIDAVLGLPRTHGLRVADGGFPAALAALDRAGALEKTARVPEDWSPEAPFFAVPAGPGGLEGFLDRAGGPAVFFRQLERTIGAKPVFARSGIPGAVGGGSLALWRALLAARRARPERFRIWPFEVELAALPGARTLVLAESYPRACYAVALADALPARPRALAKRDPAVRGRALEALGAAPWTRVIVLDPEGLAAARASEDDFDALFQAAALARLVEAGLPLASFLVDPVWEGGILGTGGLSLAAPRAPRPPTWGTLPPAVPRAGRPRARSRTRTTGEPR